MAITPDLSQDEMLEIMAKFLGDSLPLIFKSKLDRHNSLVLGDCLPDLIL